MKDFIKFTLATVTGLILTGFIVSIISIVIIIGFIASSETHTTVKKNSVMVLNLSGTITEQMKEDPLQFILGNSYSSSGLKEILASIEKAKNHQDIKGIYLKAGALITSPATIQEIRNALLKFKESGKFIVAYGDFYAQGNYYLCSVADKIMLNPQGNVNWIGMASQPMFYKDLLDKVGIEMQVFKVGTYKSAVEPYISNSMSDANREQVTAFLHSIWNQMLDGVSQSRNIAKDSLNAYADRLITLSAATDYVSNGLVDTLVYRDEATKYIQSLMFIDEQEPLNTLSLEDMMSVDEFVPKSKSGNSIAVYYAEGGIDDMTSTSDEGINSLKMCKTLRKLRDDDNIKAVVLRVNSPGGSAFGSEQIWHEVVALKEVKPVVVSMGGYAASGGYYISCAADKIIAEPTTLTGSIGIFGMIPNMEKLFTDKLGIHVDVVKTNKFSDMGTTLRPFNTEERASMQAEINRGYDLFVTRCANGREMSKEAIAKIAEGRVWTGEMAKELGLVDELGGLDKAIKVAAEEAQIDDYTVSGYPEPESFWMSLFTQKKDDYVQSQMKETFGKYYPCIQFIQSIQNQDPIQARIPFELNLNL